MALKACLAAAVRDGLRANNPVDQIESPRIEVRDLGVHPPAQLATILQALHDSQYETILLTCAFTGIRKGEAIALRWEDVDFEDRVVHIRHTEDHFGLRQTKTANGRRFLPMSRTLFDVLKTQRQLEQRLKAANQWGNDDHVFTTALGTPMQRDNVLRAVRNAGLKVGVPGVTVHSRRHSVATILTQSGVTGRHAADLMGHADVRMLAHYTHPQEQYNRDAMETVADTLVGAGLPFGTGNGMGNGIAP